MIQTAEQRPPTVEFVNFDGGNVDDCAELLRVDPAELTVNTDDEGVASITRDLTGWGEQYATRIVAGDYLVRLPYGGCVRLSPDQFAAQYRPVTP